MQEPIHDTAARPAAMRLSAAMSRRRVPAAAALLYGGMGGLIVGTFLPWFSLFGMSVGGIETDGLITLVLGIVAGPLGFLAVRRVLWASLTLLPVAAVAAVVVTYDLIHIATTPASIGIGLPLCALAVLGLLGGALHSVRSCAPPIS